MNTTKDSGAILVPMVLRAMKFPAQNVSKFKYVPNNYQTLINPQAPDSPQAAPNIKTDPPKKGVRLHWQLPSGLRHGQAGQLLAASHDPDQIPGITKLLDTCCNAEPGADRPENFAVVKSLFQEHDLALSFDASVSRLPEDNGQLWQINSWATATHYLIKIPTPPSGAKPSLEIRDARIRFPLVPNRWLVIRLAKHADGSQGQRIWILESDYVAEGKEGGCSFLDPNLQFNSTTGQPEPKPIRIGRAIELSESNGTSNWVESQERKTLFLTAVGPGDPTFAAFAPAAENVFTFWDDHHDFPLPSGADNQGSSVVLSYQVYGWYSDAYQDVLYGKDLEATLSDLWWSLAGATPRSNGCDGQRTILHGMVHSLALDADDVKALSDLPSPGPHRFAVGATSADALTAFLLDQSKQEHPDVAPKLDALQQGHLSMFDLAAGRHVAAKAARQARYGSVPGGTTWDIRSDQEAKDGIEEPTQSPELDAVYKEVAQLNVHQSNADALERQLRSQRWNLHALHWKSSQPNHKDISDQLPNAINALRRQTIQEWHKKLRDQQAVIVQAASEISNKSLPKGYRLLQRAAPRFWHPHDPVVLIAGFANPEEDEPRPLPCRASEQCLAPLLAAADAGSNLLPGVLNHPNLPAAIRGLFLENLLNDPHHRDGLLSQLPGLASFPQATKGLADVAWRQWKHPWVPVFLDWVVKWYPTYHMKPHPPGKDVPDQWIFRPEVWQFDGSDYQYKPSGSNGDGYLLEGAAGQTYAGRSILSPHATRHLIEQISREDSKAEGSNAKDFAEYIMRQRMLSQQLSGLHDRLLMRSANQSLPPMGDIANDIQDEYHTIPDPSPADVDKGTAAVRPTFFPQLSGFFVVEEMEVVDAFGQCIALADEQRGMPEPIRSDLLKPEVEVKPSKGTDQSDSYSEGYYLQQPRGLIQPARLEMRWVDCANTSNEVGLDADANPVCGWILPNHLDQALTFYAADGTCLGEVSRADGNQVEWTHGPGQRQGVDEIPNSCLQQIVRNLCKGNALDDMMNSIDATLWLVDPLGGRGDPDLSVLIGRPLVVAQLKLALTLDGDPFTNQSWANTLVENPDEDQIRDCHFPVRLGDALLPQDGLIGYFNGSEDGPFYAVHLPPELSAENARSFVQASDSYYPTVKPNGAPVFVTVLMDPRGTLHGATGLFPVKEITLPKRFVDETLRRMQLWFRVQSMLTPAGSIAIPRLSEQNGQWWWVEANDKGEWQAQKVTFSSPKASLMAKPLEVRDGWLKFEPRQIE